MSYIKIINHPILSYIIFVEGFTGKDCDKTIVPCDENPCQNGAVCLLEDEHPVCYCVPDYHGALCELRYDDCESKFARCDNGGTCIDGVNSFTCSCSPGYGGPMCEYSFPTSTSSIETEETSDQETSLSKTTIPVTSPKDSTSMLNTSVSLSSTSTSSFVTYSTTSRTSILPHTKKSTVTEKTASTLAYEDGGPLSASSAETAALPTEVPSTVITGQDDISELVTSVTTDGYTHVTETKSTEVYLPTGRSIHDGEVTKEPGDYDQTTYPVSPDGADEDATRITEYMTSSR